MWDVGYPQGLGCQVQVQESSKQASRGDIVVDFLVDIHTPQQEGRYEMNIAFLGSYFQSDKATGTCAADGCGCLCVYVSFLELDVFVICSIHIGQASYTGSDVLW